MNIIPISQLPPIFETQEKSPVKADISSLPFANVLKDSMQAFEETSAVTQKDSYDLAMGMSDDLSSIAIHSAQKTAALELTVQVASRAVSAYKEILQMQI